MTADDLAAGGRQSYERQAWADAYAQLSAAERQTELGATDLERLATAAGLLGQDAKSADFLARAYHDHLGAGAVERAARCAFWLAFWLAFRGELAKSSGWLTRAERLLTERPDCTEQGLLLLPAAYQSMDSGDIAAAHDIFVKAADVGRRYGDRDLIALASLGTGQTLIAQARTTQGVAALDEVMIAVAGGEVSAPVVGLVYCAVIDACKQIFDLRRAQEWTAALSDWCAAQPDLVPYRGQCLVHRAEIMQLHGDWANAMAEARRARDRLADPAGQPAVGGAWYQLGELHRLRGEWGAAEDAYDRASQAGHLPQPGLALLRLAQGNVPAATHTMRRVVSEAEDQVSRAHVLPAYVEIMLADHDVSAAREAADELATIAAEWAAPLLQAESLSATAAVTVAEREPGEALGVLRRAWRAWHQLDAPYAAARIRVLLGAVCRELGDEDGARTELDAARRTFELLGAKPDLAHLEKLAPSPTASPIGMGLTAREVQVLSLVAAGKTNREIGSALVISEHTVRRHLQNIFGKLDVPSRAAATAYAFKHNLV